METSTRLPLLATAATTLEPPPFESPPQDLVEAIRELGADLLDWQYERLLQSAIESLDRAAGDRARLIELLAKDLSQSHTNSMEKIILEEEWKLLNPTNVNPPKVTTLPVSQRALEYHRLKAVADTRDSTTSAYRAFHAAYARIRGGYPNGGEVPSQAEASQESSEIAKFAFNASTAHIDRELILLEQAFDHEVALHKERSEQYQHKLAASRDGGSLDYQSEAKLTYKRMLAEYFGGLAYLAAALRGIERILGTSISVPNLEEETILTGVIAAQCAARQAARVLYLFSQSDQAFTLVIPVQSKLGDDGWSRLLAGENVELPLEDQLFASWLAPRLRGVSATHDGTLTQRVALSLTPPRYGVRSDGVGIDQRKVPACHLGRVDSVALGREPEVNGSISLLNVVPIAAQNESWKLQITASSFPLSDTKSAFSDLYIELHFVGRPCTLGIASVPVWELPPQVGPGSA